jgi:hypothetical protein
MNSIYILAYVLKLAVYTYSNIMLKGVIMIYSIIKRMLVTLSIKVCPEVDGQ